MSGKTIERRCKICDVLLTRRAQDRYCSHRCVSSDPELVARRKPKMPRGERHFSSRNPSLLRNFTDAANTPESIAKRAATRKRNKRGWSEETRMRMSSTRCERISSGRISLQNTQWIEYNSGMYRSGFDVRFAKLLDRFSIPYKYEFKLVLSKCCYLVDFQCLDRDLFVEVKGYWRDDNSKMKFEEAVETNRIALVMEGNLHELETCQNKEDFVRRLEACVRPRGTTI